MEDIFELLFVVVMLLLIFNLFYVVFSEEKIEDYCISDAVLIDSFITYSKFGVPNYYLIYKFDDNSIKEFHVTSEQYYKNLQLFQEGS